MRRLSRLKSKKQLLAAPYAVWSAIFIIVPLCMILYYVHIGKYSRHYFARAFESLMALCLAFTYQHRRLLSACLPAGDDSG